MRTPECATKWLLTAMSRKPQSLQKLRKTCGIEPSLVLPVGHIRARNRDSILKRFLNESSWSTTDLN
jgi:hypothetical protein